MDLDYPSIVEQESAVMVEAVRRGPLDTMVPSCPEWTLAQLAEHQGTVHQWATYIVTHGQAPEVFPAGIAHPDEAPDFLADGVAPLVTALRTADLSEPCWNFTRANLTKAFWTRRQAIETATHRWDAQRAIESTGGPTPEPIDAHLAADAIDEWVTSIVPRIIGRSKLDLTALAGGDVHLHCTDVDGEWTFEVVDGKFAVRVGHGKATAAVRAPASDLYLYLQNRIGVDRVERFGDESLVDKWLAGLRF
jgi:uncharacterized protein (TIGR03083 family)